MNHCKISQLFLVLKAFDFLKVLWKGAYAIIITCRFSAFHKLVKEEIALEPGQCYISLHAFLCKESKHMNETGEANKVLPPREKTGGNLFWTGCTSWNRIELHLFSQVNWEIALQLAREAKQGVLHKVDPVLTPCRYGKVGHQPTEKRSNNSRKKGTFRTWFKPLSK